MSNVEINFINGRSEVFKNIELLHDEKSRMFYIKDKDSNTIAMMPDVNVLNVVYYEQII